MNTLKHILLLGTMTLAATAATAQLSELPADTLAAVEIFVPDSIPLTLDELHAYTESLADADIEQVKSYEPLPNYFFLPAVYTTMELPDTISEAAADYSGEPYMRYLEDRLALQRRMRRMRYSLFFENPGVSLLNVRLLPEPPERYAIEVRPEDHTLAVDNAPANAPGTTLTAAPIKKKHWIRTFNAGLQFSQAYVSPNWYQGGNSNLNVLGNILYNVKLNQEYHPNLLFETTAQYKLGMNNAPDDSIHSYNISDDLLQINTTFGVKAAKRWYYSFTGQFKTQLLNSYTSNSHNVRSSFLSPGELTAGVGMTYNYANPKKTVTFDASIAPLSYSLKTCINKDINPTQYGIDEGHKVKHSFGSSTELKFFWKLTYNISYSSRVFAFTDYSELQLDWENKVTFDINRFLSTQLYVHLRYDSQTPTSPDSNWKKLQVKEILSIGFAYKFAN